MEVLFFVGCGMSCLWQLAMSLQAVLSRSSQSRRHVCPLPFPLPCPPLHPRTHPHPHPPPPRSSSLVPAVCAANGHPGNPPQPPQLPRVPSGSRLTPALLCATVAALQPPGCIVVDESLTSGGEYWAMSAGAAPFTHLALTGGAIGQVRACVCVRAGAGAGVGGRGCW